MSQEVVLVVGATGLLGLEIVRRLRNANTCVRAVVRATSEVARRDLVLREGAEIVRADLKEPASLVAACQGVSTVISTVSSTRSRQSGDSIATVDDEGQLALVDAARRGGVERFVFISFPPSDIDYALQRAKRRAEAAVMGSGMAFTILRATKFSEIWLSASMGFDPAHGHARILGRGDAPVSWISFRDVARFAVAATEVPALSGKVVELGGPHALTFIEVVQIFEGLGSPKVVLDHVSERDLQDRLAQAADPLQEAYAATMLAALRGQVIDPSPALDLCPGRMITVREYATEILQMAS